MYVIELDAAVRRVRRFAERNPSMGPDGRCYYVGQSAHEPECRYRQHKECRGSAITFSCICGRRRGRFTKRLSNRYVRRFGFRLARSLYERFNPVDTRAHAEALERALAARLQAEGHGVYWA